MLMLFSDPAYLPGRCAAVMLGKQQIGVFGVVHPTVLKAFDLKNPTTILEMNVEVFVAPEKVKK